MILMGLVMVFPVAGILLFFLLPLREALPTYIAFTGASGLCHWAMMHSMRMPARTGGDAMIGTTGMVVRWDGRRGQVKWRNEIWQAESNNESSLASGDQVVIDSLSGLILTVRRGDSTPQADGLSGSSPS